MNTRIFAALFTVIFLVGAIPMLLVQPSGAASAGLAAGFVLPLSNVFHVGVLIAIGLLSAWLGREAVVLLPLCAILMLATGGLMQVDDHALPAVRNFIAGSIILFSLTVSMLRNKAHLFAVPPIAFWLYVCGGGYMANIPSITTPLYFLLGALVSAILMIAIGVSLGITLTEALQHSMEKVKTLPAISTFLSLF